MVVVTVASPLREWRESQGWSLPESSGLTGVSVSYLSRIERGERVPPPGVKVAIARGLGTTVAALFPLPEREAADA
jgi:transcriptional regulator with XRE-family HTH domain